MVLSSNPKRGIFNYNINLNLYTIIVAVIFISSEFNFESFLLIGLGAVVGFDSTLCLSKGVFPCLEKAFDSMTLCPYPRVLF